ncbi:argonaute-like protein [Agaricus bisporus var. bisporus H97]|uniref:argonaute-like protein n=1 Tax=Agaricus bisporus var. bisporus (strain H97 / ATCC MYA-4626 / FGSC 10389) TaxID=936046 RepID=UPI00029F761E|nr:argonaute-like protein [Agaricus bisporus var. bisporus H97]EKV50735.1 argonaute-like protein [Agaricus bisporus var. bisporus H97]
MGVKRPGVGSVGRSIDIQVNCYKAEAIDIPVYQYDVAIDPDSMPSRVNMEIFRQVQQDYANIFHKVLAYDGKKIAYATYQVPMGSTSRTFEVTLAPKNGGVTQKPGGRPPRVYKLKLSEAAIINTEVLRRYIAGSQSMNDAVSTSLAAFNTVLRMVPNLECVHNVRSFFNRKFGFEGIGGGIELWRGFFQSMRPGPGYLLLNVDIATCMMYRPGNLLEVCVDFFDNNVPARNLANYLANSDRERIRLGKFLSNLAVTVPATTKNKRRVIKGVAPRGADQITFDQDGKKTTVAKYFQQLGIRLQHPNLHCVEFRPGGALVPLELCQVQPGQIMRKQLPSDKTSKMVSFSTLKPPQRFQLIENGARDLQYGQSEYIRSFGLNINPTLMSLKGRILPTPKLQYGPGSKEPVVVPRFGAWNMAEKKLVRPMTVDRWLLVNLSRIFERDLQNIVRNLIQGFESTGITINHSPLIKPGDPQGNIPQILKSAGMEVFKQRGQPPQLIVIIMPDDGNAAVYSAIKHFGDIVMGVATQCLRPQKCRGANIQYWANVALKVNVKIGGINCTPERRAVPILSDPANATIIMGADVQHPAPGAEGRPSFTAVVGSVDQMASKYVAANALQVGRQELIDDLKTMVKDVLKLHMEYRTHQEKAKNPAPRKLIFFRDGVSEGQFEQVLRHELPLIRDACKEMKISPQITLCVVIKRHHIRFNPITEADRSQNCPAGTVVDTGITSPVEFDFYLQSHGGLLGTSRPSHYAVLYDENKFNADTMQSLSFALCHVYARATRSVSIPAPVYYADIVCARGKHHFPPEFAGRLSDDVSEAGSVESFRSQFMPLHDGQKKMMYFS